MKIELPQPVIWLMDLFEQHHKEIFLVGGCVRDLLLSRPIHDYDLTSNATPYEMMELLKDMDCHVIPTGLKHGTLTILKDDMEMEITTYRHDGSYEGHRKPAQVAFTTSIEEDLARRDFTINAIAWHPKHGLIDPYGGQADLQKHIIRCVGDPNKRFFEDALRILRALRFSFTLAFTIEDTCQTAIKANAHYLEYISKERIKEEFDKMLLSDAPAILQTLKEMEVLPYIIPEMVQLYHIPQETKWHCYDVFTHTDIALHHTKGYSLSEKLAIVFHDFGKMDTKTIDMAGVAHFHGHPVHSCAYAKTILKRLTYPNKMIQDVCTLITYHDYYLQPKKRILRRFLGHIDMSYPTAYAILRVQYADDMAKNMEVVQEKLDILQEVISLLKEMEAEKDILQRKDMAVNGRDMMALGYEGRAIKEVLDYLYQNILEDPTMNTKDELLEMARQFTTSI